MKELVQVHLYKNKKTKVVSARELWIALEVKKDFTSWFKYRCGQLELTEGVSYIACEDLPQNCGKIGRPSVDYWVVLHYAKHICMMENSEVGRKIRDYFIAVEEKATQPVTQALPQTFAEALRALADKVEENDKLLLENEELKPKAEFYDAVVASDDVCKIEVVCKLLDDLPYGRTTFFEVLRRDKILYRKDGFNLPMQEYVDKGYFTVKESKWVHPKTNQTMITYTPYVTQKGVEWLRKKYCNSLNIKG